MNLHGRMDGSPLMINPTQEQTFILKKIESKLGSKKVTIWVLAKVVHCFSVTVPVNPMDIPITDD